jgi:hypothetical protein
MGVINFHMPNFYFLLFLLFMVYFVCWFVTASLFRPLFLLSLLCCVFSFTHIATFMRYVRPSIPSGPGLTRESLTNPTKMKYEAYKL